MAQENRIQQLQHIANKDSRTEDKHDALAGGEISTSSSQSGITTHLVPIPITLKAQLGSPVRLSQVLFSSVDLTFAIDSLCDWGLFDNFHDTFLIFDGMARCHHRKRLHRQFLLHCR